ncbi:MAG: phage replisome organizer N-terminal domain-containing protein [Chloroflexota bacterium]
MTEKLPNYTWIKAYIDWLSDVDFMRLADNVVGIFLKLYLIAGRGDAEGLLANANRALTASDVAFVLHRSEDEIRAALETLIEAGLVVQEPDGLRIARFLTEQGPGLDEKRAAWREQQQRHREKLKRADLEQNQTKTKNRIRGSALCQHDIRLTAADAAELTPADNFCATNAQKSSARLERGGGGDGFSSDETDFSSEPSSGEPGTPDEEPGEPASVTRSIRERAFRQLPGWIQEYDWRGFPDPKKISAILAVRSEAQLRGFLDALRDDGEIKHWVGVLTCAHKFFIKDDGAWDFNLERAIEDAART